MSCINKGIDCTYSCVDRFSKRSSNALIKTFRLKKAVYECSCDFGNFVCLLLDWLPVNGIKCVTEFRSNYFTDVSKIGFRPSILYEVCKVRYRSWYILFCKKYRIFRSEPFPEPLPLPLPEPLLAALSRSSENFSISSNPINSRL